MPTQYNSPIYEGSRPGIDASSVAILRAAGALIFGKTTTTEFATTQVGPKTHNPHDLTRTPGGSSSGSAAVVADLQVPLAIGTQTLGSIIRPASFNGIFGMKPTWNAISSEGQKMSSISVDTFGVFARSVEDLKLVADLFDLKDDADISTKDLSLQNVKIGIARTAVWPNAGPGTTAAMDMCSKILREEGFLIEDVSLPTDYDKIPIYHAQVFSGDVRAIFLRESRTGKDRLSQPMINHLEKAQNLSRKDELHARDKVASLRSAFDKIADNYTVLITPSAVDEAPLGIGYTGDPAFNTIWTVYFRYLLFSAQRANL